MTLTEFRKMWADCHLVEIERRQAHGVTWLLYNVTEPNSTTYYGRHYGLYVVVNSTGHIIAHNLHNTSSRDGVSWERQIRDWWERHIEEGLIAPNGEPIPLEV
mgnify:CR=1 FL=1